MIVTSFSQGSALSSGYSSHDHVSHTLEVLDFHLPVSRYTYSGIEVNVVRSSTSRFFNKLLQLKSSREDLALFLVTCKMYGPVVPGFCEHRLLYCALILQVSSNVIGFLIAAGMHVCHATHSIYLKQNFALLILANTFILNEKTLEFF